MDFATIAGLVVALGAIFGGQALEGGSIGSVMQPTAAMIVIGGTMGAAAVQFPGHVLLATLRNLKTAFKPHTAPLTEHIILFIELAKKARRDGLVSIERDVAGVKDAYLRRGLELAVDGTESKALRGMLELELTREEEHGHGPIQVLEAMGGYSPTVGILGAVLGLIHVMENLSDPSKLGSGIAVAFVATIYGVGLANLAFLPLAGKLKYRHAEHIASREMILEGVCAIAEGEHPRLIETKLSAYLHNRKTGGNVPEAPGAGADAAREAA